MILAIIAAVAKNGVIGKDGQLPWKLKADLRRFKELTMGHFVIMGRKTYESVPHALRGRRVIVISRQENYKTIKPEPITVFKGLNEALNWLDDTQPTNTQVFIAGGAEIYAQAIDLVARMYITRIDKDFEGDVYFPEYETYQWYPFIWESYSVPEFNFSYEYILRRFK